MLRFLLIVLVEVTVVAFSMSLQCLVPLPLHFLEQLLIVGQPFVINDLANFPLDAASNHAIDGVLLTLDRLLGFPEAVWVDLGVEGKLLNRLLVFHFI